MQFGVEAPSGTPKELGLDRGGDCHVYGTSIWRSSVSRADGRRRLSLAPVRARLAERRRRPARPSSTPALVDMPA